MGFKSSQKRYGKAPTYDDGRRFESGADGTAYLKSEIDIPVYFLAPFEAQKDESVIPNIAVRRDARDIGSNFDREIAVIRNLIKQERPSPLTAQIARAI